MKRFKKVIFVILNPFFTLLGKLLKKVDLTFTFHGLKIKLPKFMTNREMGYAILGKHEKNEVKLVNKYIKPNHKVLELGACLGVVSCAINRILEEKTNQVSVEANSQMLEYLRVNRDLNNAKFHIEHKIVSIKTEIEFYIGGDAFLTSNMLVDNGKGVIVKGIHLSELVDKYFEFDILIMDIEGAELDFFRSFNLSNTSIKTIIFETHLGWLTKDEFIECFDLLKSYGYVKIDNVANVEVWKK